MYVGRGAGVDSGGVVAGHPYGLGLALGLQLALKSMFAYAMACAPPARSLVGPAGPARDSVPLARLGPPGVLRRVIPLPIYHFHYRSH